MAEDISISEDKKPSELRVGRSQPETNKKETRNVQPETSRKESRNVQQEYDGYFLLPRVMHYEGKIVRIEPKLTKINDSLFTLSMDMLIQDKLSLVKPKDISSENTSPSSIVKESPTISSTPIPSSTITVSPAIKEVKNQTTRQLEPEKLKKDNKNANSLEENRKRWQNQHPQPELGVVHPRPLVNRNVYPPANYLHQRPFHAPSNWPYNYHVFPSQNHYQRYLHERNYYLSQRHTMPHLDVRRQIDHQRSHFQAQPIHHERKPWNEMNQQRQSNPIPTPRLNRPPPPPPPTDHSKSGRESQKYLENVIYQRFPIDNNPKKPINVPEVVIHVVRQYLGDFVKPQQQRFVYYPSGSGNKKRSSLEEPSLGLAKPMESIVNDRNETIPI